MSEHQTQSHIAPVLGHKAEGHGEQHPPWWVEGPHNVQRTMENAYAPYEMWHHLQHGAHAGHKAHGAAATAQTLGSAEHGAPAITAAGEMSPATPALTTASQAAPAAPGTITAGQAAQVLKEPTTPEMAEMVENIRRTQAADQAAITASRAAPATAATRAAATTEAATATEAVTGSRAASTLGQAAKGVSTFGRAMGGLGILGGGLELYEGVQDIRHGHTQQGALDIAAGAAGVGAGGLALAGVACPPAALAAAGLGALAYGNKYTKQNNWWGTDAKGENRSAFDWAGAKTASAYQGTKHVLGGGVMGTLGGGLVAGATALGAGTAAVGGDILGGVVGAARGVGHFASRLLHR